MTDLFEKEEFLEIPVDKLSADILDSIVEEFILREGTDYGHSEKSIEDKKTAVMSQIEKGVAKIVYSSLTQNTTIMRASELNLN
ncbi:MAG: YheU family protein [Bdellovibrionales bacterium]